MVDDNLEQETQSKIAIAQRRAILPSGVRQFVNSLRALSGMPVRLLRAAFRRPLARELAASRALRAQGKFDDAEAILNSVRGARLGSVELGLEHAEIASARGDWDLAMTRWREVVKCSGDETPANVFIKLSQACRNLRDLDAAEAAVTAGRLKHPNSVRLAVEDGEIAWLRRDWAEVAKRFRRAMDLFGEEVPVGVFLKLSHAYRNLRELNEAQAAVAAGRMKHPNSVRLAVEDGEIAWLRRDWPEAAKRWRDAIDRFGEKVPAGVFLRLSHAYRNLRDLNETQAAVTAGRIKHPNSVDLALANGEIAWLRRDWVEAAKRWQAAADRFGEELPVGAFLKLSHSYRNIQDFDAAEETVKVGRARYPDSIELAIEAAETAWGRQDWVGAIACWEEAASRLGDAAPLELFQKIGHGYLLQGDLPRAQAVTQLRGAASDLVASDHTPSVKQSLVEGESRLRISIKCAAPNEEQKHVWGDYHFAKSLARALAKFGHLVRVDLRPTWNTPSGLADDVAIVLRGLGAYIPASNQINICWLISHPDLVEDRELEYYDHVFVASTAHAETLRARLSKPVSALLQCSDPDIFKLLTHSSSVPAEDLLFVGNARGERRKIVFDALAKNLPIAVYGQGWSYLVDQKVLRGENIKNEDLYVHYGAAKIVLNDHWPDMAAKGFVSNRIFDAALSGAFVISDAFDGSELFEDAIVTYETPAELGELCDRWMSDHEGRRIVSSHLRSLVLRGHTFAHRAAVVNDVILNLWKSRLVRPARPSDG